MDSYFGRLIKASKDLDAYSVGGDPTNDLKVILEKIDNMTKANMDVYQVVVIYLRTFDDLFKNIKVLKLVTYFIIMLMVILECLIV